MVHFKISSVVLFAALVASVQSRFVGDGARPGLTMRDLLEHEVFARSLEEHDSLITRDEIEELFGRHLDTDFENLSERHYDELYARHPDHFVNFFECVGNFVKRAAHDYWQHMVRKAQIIVGKEEKKDELEFLPRENEAPKPAAALSPSPNTDWFGRALMAWRDAWLPKGSAAPKDPHVHLDSREEDEDVTLWSREWSDEWEYDERDWEDLDELD